MTVAPRPLDPLEEALKSLEADRIWKRRGSPKDEAGRAVQLDIWYEAVETVKTKTQKLAFEIWEARGRLKGKAEEEANWKVAQRRYYKSLTGQEYRPPSGLDVTTP